MGIRVRDMIVVLPGIMGSGLEDASGRPLWSPGFGLAKKLIGRKKWIRELSIAVADDAADTAFLDGVRPRGLVDSMTIVPGIVRIGGYTELHDALVRNFELVEGDQHQPTQRVDGRSGTPPNYFRFAYDWRRDNRASALQLRDLIDVALPAWRTVQPQALRHTHRSLDGRARGALVSRGGRPRHGRSNRRVAQRAPTDLVRHAVSRIVECARLPRQGLPAAVHRLRARPGDIHFRVPTAPSLRGRVRRPPGSNAHVDEGPRPDWHQRTRPSTRGRIP